METVTDSRVPNRSRNLPAAYRLDDGELRQARSERQPRCVFIEVTNRCNLLCATCPRTFLSYEPAHDLTLDEFKAISAQFPEMERAVLHGIGEPLLNADLPAMIRHLKHRGVSVIFNSNGTAMTAPWQDALVASELDEFRVSLDAATPETYARIRGRPLLDRVISNLRGLVAAKTRVGATLPRISLWCMGMKENLDELPQLLNLAAKIGIPEMYLQRLTYFVAPSERRGLGQQEQALFGNLRERESTVLARCEGLARELGLAFHASGATDPRDSLKAARPPTERPWMSCLRPWTTAYITANGNVLPCCIAPFSTTRYQDLVLGNIWECGFDELWNADPYRAWRRALLGPCPHEACTGCGVYWSL